MRGCDSLFAHSTAHLHLQQIDAPLKCERGRERNKMCNTTSEKEKPEWKYVHAVNGFARLYDADNKVTQSGS